MAINVEPDYQMEPLSGALTQRALRPATARDRIYQETPST